MNHWLWLIPGSPLAGAALLAVFGGYLRPATAARLAVSAMLVCALAVGALWLTGGATHTFHQTLYTWMSVGDWRATVGLRVDKVSLVMVSVAGWVGFLIHLFSVHFMADDYGERRYYVYLNLFVAGMLLFVMADNLLLLYLGWELMGLCSYALISHWYRDAHKAWCGRKAFVVTRIGDSALALAIFLLFAHYHTLDFDALFTAAHGPGAAPGLLTWVALLTLIGAAGKSAQLPLSVWLPDAMAGPSTVSALIHAATMVTAGVYLIARLHPLFELAPDVLVAGGPGGGHHARVCRPRGPGPARHQARHRLFHHQPDRLHVPGSGRGGIQPGPVPSRDPRLLQGSAVHVRRRGHQRVPGRPRHPQHGGPGPPATLPAPRVPGGLPSAGGGAVHFFGFLQQGPDHRIGMDRAPRRAVVGSRHPGGGADRRVCLPPLLHGLPWPEKGRDRRIPDARGRCAFPSPCWRWRA